MTISSTAGRHSACKQTTDDDFRKETAAMHETDEQIYSRFLAEGCEDDLRILLERHRDGLMLFLFSCVHNMEDAEELMLDAFAEAAAGAGFSGRSSFKTWLFSIGKKLAFMRLRKTRFTYSLEDKMIREPDCFPELNILTAERNQQLYQALGQLKEEYRQILILMYFEEMSHEEIGKVMGKTKRQTYHLAERGRAALREKLERMGFDYAQY